LLTNANDEMEINYHVYNPPLIVI